MKERISGGTKAALIATSLAWQGIGFFAGMVPVVGSVWEWTGYIVFFVWFAILGVSFMQGKDAVKKFGAMLGGLITESIPFLNMIPAQTASVLYVIYTTRREDRDKARQSAAKAANDNHKLAQRRSA